MNALIVAMIGRAMFEAGHLRPRETVMRVRARLRPCRVTDRRIRDWAVHGGFEMIDWALNEVATAR